MTIVLYSKLLKKIKNAGQFLQYENNRIFGFKLSPYGYNEVY